MFNPKSSKRFLDNNLKNPSPADYDLKLGITKGTLNKNYSIIIILNKMDHILDQG